MLKTFKYRIYPTKQQVRILSQQIAECRWLYNHLLAERRDAWKERQEALSYYDQATEIPPLKEQRPSLKIVHSQVLQNVAVRLDLAMKAFFRRIKEGEKEAGYPRFRGRNRYDSLTFPQVPVGCKVDGRYLIVSKVGTLKMVYHRPIEGTPKTATLRRMPTSKWFVTIACEWEPTALPPIHQDVGIDVGLKTFAMLSDGQEITNPRFFRQEEKALAKAQRKHAKALDAHRAKRAEVTKQMKHDHPEMDDRQIWQQVNQDIGERVTWKERQKRRKVVARTHERTRWRRENFTHQQSRRIVNQFDCIAVEDLSVNRMMHTHCLAKSIADVAWRQFAELLRIKAEWAGRAYIAVNPAYTSQNCSGCGHRKSDLSLADRVYHCDCCGLVIDRDLNASLNILAVGRHCLLSS